MAGTRKKSIRCKFSNRKVTIEPFGPGFRASSEYGWTSRIFSSEEAASEWARSCSVGSYDIVQVRSNLAVRYRVRGDGWFSHLLETEEDANFWVNHRGGRPIGDAKPRTKIEVREVEEPIDPELDVDADVKDLYSSVEEAMENAPV